MLNNFQHQNYKLFYRFLSYYLKDKNKSKANKCKDTSEVVTPTYF